MKKTSKVLKDTTKKNISNKNLKKKKEDKQKLVETFPSEIVKKVTFKPYSKMTTFGESNELLQLEYSDKLIIIKAMMDCCSQSYLVQFSEFPFKNIKNKIITKLLLINNEELKKKYFSNIKLLKLQEHNQLYLYQIKFKSKDEFYIGLVNSSNGYYDGYIELYEKNLPKKKKK